MLPQKSEIIDVVCRAWARALGGEIDADSDFFALGGNSLAALEAGAIIAHQLQLGDASDAAILAIFDVEPATPRAVATHIAATYGAALAAEG